MFLYLLSVAGQQQLIDTAEELQVAQSIVRDGSFAVQPDVAPLGGASVGIGQRLYAAHGLGASLFLLPAAIAGSLVPASHSDFVAWWVAWLLNPVVGAATAVLICACAIELGASLRLAVCLALVFALGTQEWPSTRDAFDVTPTAFYLLLAFYGLVRYEHGHKLRWLLASGGALAITELIRLPSAIWWLPLAGYVWFTTVPGSACRRSGAIVLWSLPFVAVCLVIAWFNWVRFGNPLLTGHSTQPGNGFSTPILAGVAGLLLSPDKSMLLFNPVLVLALAGFPRFSSHHRHLAITIVATALCTVLFYAKFDNWSGDWAWGPRYMVMIVPLLILLALPVLARFAEMAPFERWLVCLVVAASVGVQLLSVTADVNGQDAALRNAGVFDLRYWHLQYSQIFVSVRDLWSGIRGFGPSAVPDTWWHSASLSTLTHGLDRALAVGLAGISAVSLFLLYRYSVSENDDPRDGARKRRRLSDLSGGEGPECKRSG